MTSRATIAILGIGTLLMGGLGFLLNLDGFGSNLLAELVGVSLSVLIAYTLVEALLRRQRREQWASVNRAINAAIENRIQAVAFDFYLVDSAPDTWPKASTPREHAAALDSMVVHLVASQDRLADDPDDENATTRKLHRRVTADLGFIRDVLAPRVIELGEDATLSKRWSPSKRQKLAGPKGSS